MNRKIFSWTLVVFWMAVIFYFSHQPANSSNGLSTGITEKIIEMVVKIAPNLNINIRSFNHIIRKNAHFFIYLILGILVSNGQGSSKITVKRGFILALSVCILYAISDELHQLFVPGRAGQVKDIIIDSAGSLVGIALYYKSRIFDLFKP